MLHRFAALRKDPLKLEFDGLVVGALTTPSESPEFRPQKLLNLCQFLGGSTTKKKRSAARCTVAAQR